MSTRTRPHPVTNRPILDHYEVNWRNKVVGILDNVTPETIKDLKPVMSHDTPEVEIRTSEQSRGGGRWQTRRVRIVGCPSFVNCSTWLKWDPELSSRHFYLTPRDDPKKYEASAELLNELHTTGRLPTSEIASQIQDAIRWLRDDNLQVVLAKDTAAQVKADFKWNSGRDIRAYERMLTLVEAVGWLHAFQRERTDTDAVIADQRDLEIVKGLSDELLKTTRTGTSAQVLDYYERVLKPLSESGGTLMYDAIQQKYFEVYNRRLHRDILILYNKTLQDLNKIDLSKDPIDRRRWLVRVL